MTSYAIYDARSSVVLMLVLTADDTATQTELSTRPLARTAYTFVITPSPWNLGVQGFSVKKRKQPVKKVSTTLGSLFSRSNIKSKAYAILNDIGSFSGDCCAEKTSPGLYDKQQGIGYTC